LLDLDGVYIYVTYQKERTSLYTPMIGRKRSMRTYNTRLNTIHYHRQQRTLNSKEHRQTKVEIDIIPIINGQSIRYICNRTGELDTSSD